MTTQADPQLNTSASRAGAPTLRQGVGLCLVVALVPTGLAVFGARYSADQIPGGTALLFFVPTLLVAVLVAGATTLWRCWSPVLREVHRTGAGWVTLRTRTHELGAWLGSTVVFALLNSVTLVALGLLIGTLIYLPLAFVLGSVMYVVRRWSGGLLLPIVLHAGWQFGLTARLLETEIVPSVGTAPSLAPLFVGVALVALTAAALVHILRRDARRESSA